MTPERWQRIQEVFEGAADRPAGERDAWIEAACQGDGELLREVESLLAHEVEGTLFLRPLVEEAAQRAAAEGEPPGDRRIGPYRITGTIGHGGMGTVFLALRDDDQYRKQVAIKLIQQGMVTDFALHRFREERQILAGLEHPHIARLLEGGTTAEGLPYFAMEYVRGLPITEHCRARGLSIPARLQLFRQVCSAVQHAHRNLVIHRDLKPSNVLVADDGTPKLLDFGIAKLLGSEPGEDASPRTVTAMRMLTPDYASPEQVRGGPMTTATDVYSLGAVLYELLTEKRPHEFKDLSMLEIERVICRTPVEKASAAAGKNPALPRRWARQIAGDLDTITAVALNKEPARRYGSVEQLSEDLRCHLEGLPVVARADSFGYRAGKFARRHKLALTAALLVLLSLSGGIAATSYQARRAQRRFQQVRQLANTFLFDFHDAIRDLPGSMEARQMLVTTALEYLDNLAREAGGDRSLRLELVQAYQRVARVQGDIRLANLGQLDAGLASHRKALALAQGLAARYPRDPATLRVLSSSYRNVGDLLAQAGDFPGGLDSLHRSLEVARRLDPAQTGELEDLMLHIRASELLGDAQLQVRDVAGALASYRTTLELCRRREAQFPGRKGLGQNGLALSYARLGDALAEQGDLKATLEAYREALRLREAVVEAFPNNAMYRRELKTLYNWLGNYLGNPDFINLGETEAALDYYRRGLALAEVFVAEDPRNGLARYDLAISEAKVADMLAEGEPEEAAGLYRKAIGTLDELLAPNPAEYKYLRRRALYQRGLAVALRGLGDVPGALSIQHRCLETLEALALERSGSPELAADLHETWNGLGDLQLEAGDLAAALDSYRRGLEVGPEPDPEPPAQGAPDLYALWRRAGTFSRMGALHGLRGADPAASLEGRIEQWKEAEAGYLRALELWETWSRDAVSSDFDRRRREQARRSAQRCRAERAKLESLKGSPPG